MIRTAGELLDFLDWVREEFEPEVFGYVEAHFQTHDLPHCGHVVLDEAREKFLDSETRAARKDWNARFGTCYSGSNAA